MIFRSRALLDSAKGQPCARCGRTSDTTVAAHYHGAGQARLGKGKGIKPHDFCVADLCYDCHIAMDEKSHKYFMSQEEMSLEFLLLVMETLARKFKTGVIIVKGDKDE